MPTSKKSTFINIGLITIFSVGGLVACHTNDYNESSGSANADSSMNSSTVSAATSSNSSIVAADKAAKDTAALTAQGAVCTDKNVADIAKTIKKKRSAYILMPAGNNDKMTSDMMVKDKQGVYSTVQVMPEFPGGQNALADYVNNNVQYPQQAIDDNATGTVRISFVVDENGKVTNAQLMNGGKAANGLEQEALRLVNKMPAWKPGKVKGKNVKTRLDLPINFQVES